MIRIGVRPLRLLTIFTALFAEDFSAELEMRYPDMTFIDSVSISISSQNGRQIQPLFFPMTLKAIIPPDKENGKHHILLRRLDYLPG